jgi:hypothetical protein
VPVVGAFHTFYWENSDTRVTPVSVGGPGGYPNWQASVVAASLLGALGAWLDVRIAQAQWLYRFVRRLYRLEPERRAVLVHTLDTLERPTFQTARIVVRETAQTLGFNQPGAWKDLGRALKEDMGRSENTFRHLRAMQRLRDLAGSTLTNPEQNFLVELAYQGFALKGK